MIIVGYQGIGKSSAAGVDNGIIDLESGNFWVDGKRNDDWYIIYCNIAEHLSQQGFVVFTSSHEVVRKQLANSKELKLIIFPSLDLKDEWIKRLELRYLQTKTDKDYKALMNAKDRYCENIQELQNDNNFKKIKIQSMNYDLKNLISRMIKNQYEQ